MSESTTGKKPAIFPNAVRETAAAVPEVRGKGTTNTAGAKGTARRAVVSSATPFQKVYEALAWG